jgi:hypothetical protein
VRRSSTLRGAFELLAEHFPPILVLKMIMYLILETYASIWIAVRNMFSYYRADTDEDVNFRRPKRHRASFRPPSDPRTPRTRSDDDGDGATPSSPGQSHRGYSGGDVPMTDQTDDDPYWVLAY